MLKNLGASGSFQRSTEGEPHIGIRVPDLGLTTISEGPEKSTVAMASLASDIDSIQAVV